MPNGAWCPRSVSWLALSPARSVFRLGGVQAAPPFGSRAGLRALATALFGSRGGRSPSRFPPRPGSGGVAAAAGDGGGQAGGVAGGRGVLVVVEVGVHVVVPRDPFCPRVQRG